MSTVTWENAKDIDRIIRTLVRTLELKSFDPKHIHCFRSYGSSSRAYARIWGLSKIWQQALNTPPAYAVEVLSEKFDRLNDREKIKVLIHELTHIPSNFSGALMPHVRRGKRSFHKKVDFLISQYFANEK